MTARLSHSAEMTARFWSNLMIFQKEEKIKICSFFLSSELFFFSMMMQKMCSWRRTTREWWGNAGPKRRFRFWGELGASSNIFCPLTQNIEVFTFEFSTDSSNLARWIFVESQNRGLFFPNCCGSADLWPVFLTHGFENSSSESVSMFTPTVYTRSRVLPLWRPAMWTRPRRW